MHSHRLFFPVDEEMMSTEVTPPSNSELTELGKCLMKQEVRKLSFHSFPMLCAHFERDFPLVDPSKPKTELWTFIGETLGLRNSGAVVSFSQPNAPSTYQGSWANLSPRWLIVLDELEGHQGAFMADMIINPFSAFFTLAFFNITAHCTILRLKSLCSQEPRTNLTGCHVSVFSLSRMSAVRCWLQPSHPFHGRIHCPAKELPQICAGRCSKRCFHYRG